MKNILQVLSCLFLLSFCCSCQKYEDWRAERRIAGQWSHTGWAINGRGIGTVSPDYEFEFLSKSTGKAAGYTLSHIHKGHFNFTWDLLDNNKVLKFIVTDTINMGQVYPVSDATTHYLKIFSLYQKAKAKNPETKFVLSEFYNDSLYVLYFEPYEHN